MPANDFDTDYFISRRGTVAAVAKEVAGVLNELGFKSFSQDHDIPSGANFIIEINKALKRCRHFIALATEDYDESAYTQAEWSNFYAAHVKAPTERRFIVILAESCKLHGLFEGIVYASLAGVTDPEERRKRIIAAVEGKSAKVPYTGRLFENIPSRDLNFTGREERLEELHKLLWGGNSPTAITQAAVHGLGGIGKTTLAAEYVHRYAGAYSGVWWAPAENRAVLIASLAALAGRLDARLAEEPNEEKAARTGLSLMGHRAGLPMLLVYDNADSPETVRDLLPSDGARSLITTRYPDWGGLAIEIKLDVLSPVAAADFLQKRAGRTDRDGADRLARALGYLPLALDHAGAYCKTRGTSFEEYGKRIDARIAFVPRGAPYPDSVAATFELAIEKAASEHGEAEILLSYVAFLAPERIPLDLIDDDLMSYDNRAEALAALASAALVEHVTLDDGKSAITIHRLVQMATRRRLAERGKAAATLARTTQMLDRSFPLDVYREPSTWPRCAMLLPHVLSLREHSLWSESSGIEAVLLLNRAASYLKGRANYVDAEPLLREAIAVSRTIGEDHRAEVGRSLNNLANLLIELARYSEAESLLREAAAIIEAKLGRDHQHVGAVLSNLASVLQKIDRTAEAETLFREVIAIDEKARGRKSWEVAVDLANLAVLLAKVGRHSEAEVAIREALSIGIKTGGADHPTTAQFNLSLSGILARTNRKPEALSHAEAGYTALTKSLGSEHPLTRLSAHEYALLLSELGRKDEVEGIKS